MDLTTIDRVSAALGRALTEEEATRAQHAISLLSAKFAEEARRDFAPTEYTHRLKVNGGHVRPPRSPLLEVVSVVDDDGSPVEWTMRSGFVDVPLASDAFVVVTYRAGLTEVPDAVALQLADSVARLLRVDVRAQSGMTQANKTAGPYSEGGTFASWAVGGQSLLSPDDLALARSLRPKRPGNVWVMGS